MPNHSALANRRQTAQDLHAVVISLQEISVLEMQKIREQVLENRQSMEQLIDIFIDIRLSQKDKTQKTLRAEKQSSSNSSPNRQCYVFLSQNQKFSDTNVSHVWKQFLDRVQKHRPAGIAIVGNVGKELAQQNQTVIGVNQAQYYDLSAPPGKKATHTVQELLQHVQQFDEVILFHGQFQNLLKQEPVSRELSGKGVLLDESETAKREQRSFLLEPSLPSLIKYFEQEVERGILQQTLEESRLAHVGSRVQTLESSRHTIEEKLSSLRTKMRREKRRNDTKKQQQRLAGRSLWK